MAKEDLLTHESIILETNAVQRARDLGRDDLPKVDADELDTCEMDIIRKCEQRANDLISQARVAFHNKISDLKIRSPKEMRAALDGIASSVDATILKTYQKDKHKLAEAYKEMKRRQRDYRHFRVVNELNREPSYVKSVWKRGVIAFVILLFEIVANGFFLGMVSEGGWGEAALKILFLSGSIVAAGYIAGFMCRYFWHKRAYIEKLIASVCIVFGPTYIVLAGFFAAHNRLHILEILNDVETPLPIIDSMLVQFFAPFNSLEATILVIAAVLSGSAAAFEGFMSWDRYPGYDKVHSLWEQKRVAYEGIKAAVLGDIEASVATLRDRAAEIEKEALENITTASNFSNRLNSLKSEVEQISRKAGGVCKSVLKEFREENKKVRMDNKAPKYFSTYPDLEIDVSLENELRALKEAGISDESYKEICVEAAKTKEKMAARVQTELEKVEKFYGDVEQGATNELVEEESALAAKVSV